MAQFSLSAEQVSHYCAEGFLVLPRFFDSEAVRRVLDRIDAVTREALTTDDFSDVLELEPEHCEGKRVARRIFNPFDRHADFRQLAEDERLLDAIESLVGPDINLQHSKLNMKPAEVGSVVEWHQDMAYFPHTNDDLLAALIYLDEATVANGCLQVLPRHHFHYFNHNLADGQFAGMITEDLSDNRYGRPVALEASAGSVILLHCLAPHCSLPNRSNKARRTLIFEYRAADSYPIYFGEMTAINESLDRPLRGKPARFARFGGPPPLIPKTKRFKSLYDIQARTKAEHDVSSSLRG
jgi:ectoine hydroxylase-related dioxygenase (phytanoyl-CoA dioxygenase family)